MLFLVLFLLGSLDAVTGWKCPADPVIPRIYVKSGQPAVIGFQTTIQTFNRQILYSVVSFNDSNFYSATFYNNVLQTERSFLQSVFIGDASTGNFTVKTKGVHIQDGGVYMLQYKQGTADVYTEMCSMLFVIGTPQKATVSYDNNNVLGRDSQLSCNSLSTTYPTNHTLSLTYNWKENDVINPVNTRYTYEGASRKTLTITSVTKGDANKRFKCSATESGNGVTGLTSDYSDKFVFIVIYGPDSSTTQLSPPNTEYILNEGVRLNDITCIGDCYPRCNYKWTKQGTNGASIVNNTAVLSLWTLSRTEAATYTCEVTNANATVRTERKQVAVHVNYGPDASTTKLTPSPTTYTHNEGDSLNDIQCSGNCYPSCNYMWTKSGNNTAVKRATLSIGSLDRTEAGTYTCTVSNPTTGEKQTKTVSISVRYGPDADSTTLTPDNTAYTRVENTRLDDIVCAADCYPECQYRWTKPDNTVVSNNGVLSLGSLKRNEATTYTCIVTRSQTTVSVTKQVSVIVIYGPDAGSVTLNPVKRTYTENEGTRLNDITCSTACYPTCSYKWTKSGTNTVVNTTGDLTLGTLNKDKAATYTCTATNPRKSGSAATDVIVHVRYGPDKCNINIQSPYALAEGNTSTEITCQSDCYPSCSYKWINSSSGKVVGSEGMFQLDKVTRYEAGNYTCSCENTAIINLSKATPLQVIVNSASLFIEGHKGKKDVTVDEYDTDIQFNCEIDSYQESRIQILFKDVILKEAHQRTVLTFTRSSIMCSHAGVYTCKGSSQHAQAPSSKINLFVRCSPRPIHQIKQNKTSSLYVPATLTFTTIAYPEPGPTGFFWHKESGVLWMPLLSNNDLLVSSSGLQSNLTVLNVSQSDYGSYRVTATNDIGSYVQYIFLVREDIQKEIYTTESCEVESNKTGTIVGICFGALSACLAVYASYLTVLHKRRSTRKGKQTTEDLNTQVTYINIAEEGTVRHINDSSGNKDDSAKLYTELAQYSKDEKSTYDVIQKN